MRACWCSRSAAAQKLPEPTPYTPPRLDPPPSIASADVIANGERAYNANCSVCHGAGGVQARTSFPNLTVSALLYSQPGFDQVVLQGVRTDKGMGSFAKELEGRGLGRHPRISDRARECVEERAAGGGTARCAARTTAGARHAAAGRSRTRRPVTRTDLSAARGESSRVASFPGARRR